MKIYTSLFYSKNCIKNPPEKFFNMRQIILKHDNCNFIFLKKIFIKIDGKSKTLFLDLDETLVHSCAISHHPEYILKVKRINEKELLVLIF